MPLLRKLQIGNNDLGKYSKEYLLSDYKLHTFRKTDNLRPETQKYCERIELTVIAPGREDVTLYEWFIEQSTLNGRILIVLPPQGEHDKEETKEILFDNASCFALEEDYHIGVSQRRTIKLSLVADIVEVEGIIYKSV